MPKGQSECEKMHMGNDCRELAAAPDFSCCTLSNSPAPVQQTKTPELSISMAPVVTPVSASLVPGAERERPILTGRYLSPPRLRSLLCTLLI